MKTFLGRPYSIFRAIAVLVAICPRSAGAQDPASPGVIDTSQFEDGIRHWVDGRGGYDGYKRYSPLEYRAIADNLLRFQNADGGWPKNVDWMGELDKEHVIAQLSSQERRSTCDNRNTYSQIEYLSQAFVRSHDQQYRKGAERGLEFILATQHASGGWRGADVDAITFNDDLMTGIMNLLLDIQEGRPYYSWIDANRRRRLRDAFERALDVTLRCQIVVRGMKTGWCQQHDHKTLEPIKARAYELPSIASLETASVVEFLVRLKNPTPEVREAIRNAVHWMKRSTITGIRLERINVDDKPVSDPYKRYDTRVVSDSSARPTWARYYEIETNRPFFSNRDGVKVYSLAEVQLERRLGYAWYGNWPGSVLRDIYPAWSRQLRKDIPRDTSFTVSGEFQKTREKFPLISIVTPRLPANVEAHEDIAYASIGSRDLLMDVYAPRNSAAALSPTVILIHGGGWRSGEKEQQTPLAQQLAARGYVAACVEYRLSPEAGYPAGLYDLKAAVRWLRAHAANFSIDTTKIAALGCSAGGTLAALLGVTGSNPEFEGSVGGLQHSSAVQAVVDIDGIVDFTDPAESGKDTDPVKPSAGRAWLGAAFKDQPGLWHEASPVNHVSESSPPVLFINSAIDRFHAGRDEMIVKLRSHRIRAEVKTLPDTPHPFWLFHPWFEPTVGHTVEFLDAVLKIHR